MFRFVCFVSYFSLILLGVVLINLFTYTISHFLTILLVQSITDFFYDNTSWNLTLGSVWFKGREGILNDLCVFCHLSSPPNPPKMEVEQNEL